MQNYKWFESNLPYGNEKWISIKMTRIIYLTSIDTILGDNVYMVNLELVLDLVERISKLPYSYLELVWYQSNYIFV